jgi:hypothetical protein
MEICWGAKLVLALLLLKGECDFKKMSCRKKWLKPLI